MTAARYTTKLHEGDTRERLRAFWAGSSLGRPALNVIVRDPAAPPEPALPPKCGGNLKAADLRADWQAARTAHWLRAHRFLAEAMPGAHLLWGSHLATLPVLAGGDYEYQDSAWIKPLPGLPDRPLPAFDPDAAVVHALEACYAAAAEPLRGQAFLTPPLMMDGLTTLSLFREPDQFCVDLLEQPELVKRWSGALTDLYIAAYEHFFHYLQRLGVGGESICFFGPLAEGRSEGVQCDCAVMLSPDMYREFVLPDLRRVTEYFDRSLYHLDGTCQMRFLDLLRSLPKLDGIQWNPETTAGSPLRWLAAFREIRRRKFCLYIGCSVTEAVALTQELGPDGLFLSLPVCTSEAEAEAAIAAVTRAAQAR